MTQPGDRGQMVEKSPTTQTVASAFTRRALLRAIAAGAASVALASCGGATGAPTATAGGATITGGTSVAPTAVPGQPIASKGANASAATSSATIKRGGQLIQASNSASPGWDVHLASTIDTSHISCYECLLRYVLVDPASGRFELRPGLAESWEQPDPQTLILHLRQGVTFHDGSSLTASVVKWNLDRIINTPQAIAHGQFTVIGSTEAPDPMTVRLKLKTPSAAILTLLSDGATHNRAIISQAQFEKLGAQEFNRNGSGTGPMRLKQFIQDDRSIMEPFKDYWDKGADGKPLPYLDGLIYRYIPDLTTALVELQSGGIDIIRDMPPKDFVTAKANPKLGFIDYTWDATTYFNLGFNLKKPPFDNPKVRQAVLYGMDRDAIVKAVGFGAGSALLYNYWVPAVLGYDETIPNYKYNPDKAKQLLIDAGVPSGVNFELRFIDREPDTTSVQLQQQVWSKLGIQANLVKRERLAWIDDMKAGNFQAGAWRIGVQFDPDLTKLAVVTGGGQNYSGFSDPDIDQWMTDGGATLDTQQRAAAYKKVMTRLYDQAYIGPGYEVPSIFGYQKNVQGYSVLFFDLDHRATWKG